MKQLNPQATGLVVGTFAVVMHLIWLVLIATGLAQVWVDFVYSIHFLNNPFTVATFDITKALTLIIIVFIVGFIIGNIFARVWNTITKSK